MTHKAMQTLEKHAKYLGNFVDIDKSLKTNDVEAWAILIAEALNLRTKILAEANRIFPIRTYKKDISDLYEMKYEAIKAAIDLGVECGINEDDDGNTVVFLYTASIGVASFHLSDSDEKPTENPWDHSWCSVRRLVWANAALENEDIRKFLGVQIVKGAELDMKEFTDRAMKIYPNPYVHLPY